MKHCGLLLLLILCLSSCTPSRLEIDSRNFEDEIALQQNLVFRFNQPVVSDSLLEQWSSRTYLRIEPAVDGRFRWTDTKELVFSPSSRFQPATEYKVYLTDELPRAGNLSLGVDPEPITVSTPMPALKNAEAFWTRAAAALDPELRLHLQFNYSIEPTNLQALLQVKHRGNLIQYTLLPPTEPDRIVIRLQNPELSPDQATEDLEIFIQAGLATPEGPGKSKEPQKISLEVPEASELSIISVETESTPDGGQIRLLCNQGLDLGDNPGKWFSVNPSIPIRVEALDYGCLISGAFQPHTEYELTIKAGMQGMLSGALASDQSFTLNFNETGPVLEFLSANGMYMSPLSSGNLGLRIKGMEEVELTVARIYQNNILSFFREESYPDYYYDEENEESYVTGRDWAYAGTTNHGDVILNKKISLRSLPVQDDYRLLNPGLDQMRSAKGVYFVRVSSATDRWVRDARLISFSDIGLTAKVSGDEVWVFAHSIKTAEPVAGVTLSLISTNNQTMSKATTDAQGVGVFKNLKATAAGFKPRMITAVHSQDFTFLDLSSTKVETDRWEDLAGLKTGESGLIGYLYGDRNLYRPGDTLHLAALIRNLALKPISGQPVKVRILLPNGKEAGMHKLMPGQQGQAFLNLPIGKGGMTGTWQAELLTGDEQPLFSYRFSVEEFTPDRIAVQVNAGKNVLYMNETLQASATATMLYGPPAAGKSWEADIQFRRKPLKFKAWPGYQFNPDARYTGSDLLASERRSGVTDDQGNFSFQCPLSGLSSEAGKITAQAFISVLDETGKTVHRLAEYEVLTQPYFPGVKCQDSWVSAGSRVPLSLITLNPSGVPVAGTVQVQVVRYLWQNVVEKDYRGYFNFKPRKQEVTISEVEVRTGTSATIHSVALPASGEYEVRITAAGSSAPIRVPLYAWGWGSTRSNSFQVNREGQILITADKAKASPGEKVKLLFRTPFAGKLMVTLERDKVLEYRQIETDQRSASLEIDLKEAHVPNVIVSAVLLKPLDDGAMPLTIAYGYLNLKVENPKAQMSLEVTGPEQIRSGKPHTFVVKGPPNTELTISVVDEGVLLMKNYNTPDLYKHFYSPRALETQTHSLYPLLFPDLRLKKLAYGGDGYSLGRRVNPFLQSSKSVIAAWSGPIKTNSAGEASLRVNIPVYAGAVRVMAAAWNQASFGTAERVIRIADPLVLNVNVPPALAPGDSLVMPVIVSKTTAGQASASVAVSVGKGLKVKGKSSQSIALTPNREKVLWFTIYAESPVEKTNILTLVTCGSENIREESSLTIQPPSAFTGDFKEGKITSGQQVSLAPGGNWYPGTLKRTLMAGASPLAGISWHLKELIQYPHGCLEQTVSAAFPQLYLPALSEAAGLGMKTGGSNTFVQEAIRKLERMQLYHGGFAYWEGGTEVSDWGSVYALHFLIEADKAGFPVRKQLLESGLKWLSGLARNRREGYDDAVVQDNDKVIRVPSLTAIYALFVLAEAGKPERAAMNYFKGRQKELSELKKYLLATAYHYTGEVNTARALTPPAFTESQTSRESSGEFNSWIRNQAMVLNALLELSPNQTATKALADKLLRQLAQTTQLNTQERAMALLALGKYAAKLKPEAVVAEISFGGKTVSYSSASQPWLRLPVNGEVSIRVISGTLYYNLFSEGYATRVTTAASDAGLKVRKTYLTRTGKPVELNRLKRNELVIVRLSIQAEAGRTIDNVVLTDLIPPGLEVENHRIAQLPDFALSPAPSQPEHLDIRRDRLMFFTSVNGTEKHFYYLARAMWAGAYQIPPVTAECMYDASLKSVNGSGRISILE